MRTKFSLILVVASFSFLPTLNAQTPAHVTGKDWLLMSYEEKVFFSASAMDVLKKNGVPLEKTFEQYITLLDEDIMCNYKYRDQELTNVLASIVYENEPGTRGALDNIRK